MEVDNVNIWLIRLRWCALCFGLYAFYGNHNPILLTSGAVLLFSNLIAIKYLKEKTIPLFLILDIILLTLVLSVTGGPANPFSVLYLVHITLTATALGAKWTWLIACFSVAAFGSLFIFDTTSHAHHGSFSDHLKGMWNAFALASILIAYFVSKILNSLKIKDQQMLNLKLELEKSSKFASLVTLSAGAAHELSTPISTISLIASELDRINDSKITEDVKILKSEVDRCKNILEEMRTQADIASPEQWQLVSHQQLAEMIEIDSIDNKLTNPCSLPLLTLVKTLNSLISNARDAKSKNIKMIAEQENTNIIFKVIDDGVGMSQETLERATEPFFTTKANGKGMGLGLFLARIFSEQLGGRIEILSNLNLGTSITIKFPNLAKLSKAA